MAVRCHPTLAPAAGRDLRVEHEYQRGGRPPIPGRLGRAPSQDLRALRTPHRHRTLRALVDQVMSSFPYATDRRVFWVVDNGSSHRGQAACDTAELVSR